MSTACGIQGFDCFAVSVSACTPESKGYLGSCAASFKDSILLWLCEVTFSKAVFSHAFSKAYSFPRHRGAPEQRL